MSGICEAPVTYYASRMNAQDSFDPPNVPAPLALHRERVQPEWIDYNGHMNLAYYMLAFDHATDAFFDYIGLGEAYLKARNASTFTLEGHITYDRELMDGSPMRFETQLLAHDAKRLHYIHFMYHADEGYLASTNELISLHVDMTERRSAPMPDSVIARLDAVAATHDKLPHPEQAGRVISIVR